MSLKFTYSLIAPFYDAFVASASARLRAASLLQLPVEGPRRVLLTGAGTGLDFPYLPDTHHYTALDLTAAMLARARPRIGTRHIDLVQGNSLDLPFADEAFDHVVLHLILAVVPDPARCLREAARVVRPGGWLIVLDKFLKPGETALLRRSLNPLVRRVATRLDVVFEDVLEQVPGVRIESDLPVLAGGWFRSIRLVKSREG